MLADLEMIEVKKKLNKSKLFWVILVLLLITISVIAGINYGTNNTIPQEDSDKSVEQIAMKKQKRQLDKNILLPNLTEIGKEKVKNIYHADTKTAYLTFDDGPSKSVTPLILDYLKNENIKATFFVLGSRVELAPEVLRRAHAEGHYIANHGYSHVYSSIYANTYAVLDEYSKTEQCIKNALDNQEYSSHLFRFPGGSTGGKYNAIKQEAKCLLEENNVAYVDWNALTQDAAGSHTKEQLLQNLKDTVQEKSSVVILMHDAGDKILSYETLPDIVAYLREKGYVFKSFYDIIQ